jgi:hypothetical protein
MSYNLPKVSVFQTSLRASQNLADSELLPCLVGPLNQVETDVAISLTLPVTTLTTITYPNVIPLAVIDTTSVKVKVKNAWVMINAAPIAVATTLVAGSNTIVGTAGAFTNAKAGDKITMVTANHGTFTIATVIDSTHVTTVETISFPAVATTDTFNITRNVGDINCVLTTPTYSTTSFSINGLTYQTYNVVSGDSVNVSYVALRKDLQGFYEVTNQDQLVKDMSVNILNPLGFCLGQVMASANGGKKILAYILADNSDASYTTALSDIATRKDSYLLVPLSQTSTVRNAFASHAIAMSQPDISSFRAAILPAPALVTTKINSTGTALFATLS